MDLLKFFKVLNYLLGTTVVVSAFYIYLTTKKTIPLYIALAIIIAGPLEDLLIAYIEGSPLLSPTDKEQYINMVDNITSLFFLVLLGLVILQISGN